jgi:hypothetical protein
MSTKSSARHAQPQNDVALIEVRTNDAEPKNRAKGKRRLEHYRERERAAQQRKLQNERAWARRATARYQERHPMIVAAWEATKAAIRHGEIQRGRLCEAQGG